MRLHMFCLLLGTAQAAVRFGPVHVLGRVSSPEVVENSGLGASRVHDGILYGHNDGGDDTRIFAFNTTTADVQAEFVINNTFHYDWEDLAVGVCGQRDPGPCIYIADIGGNERPLGEYLTIYKVREPTVLSNSTLQLEDSLHFEWGELDSEGVIVDPKGEVYVVSKVEGGNGLLGKLPNSAWGQHDPVTIPAANTARLGTYSSSFQRDPRGADLSPDGRNMLVKARDSIFFLRFSENMDYIGELSRREVFPTVVPYNDLENNGQAVAWNEQGTGFYTLPEGTNPVLKFHPVNITEDSPMG